MLEALTRFADLLDERLALGVFTTEDTVRYTFYHSILQTYDLSPADVVLEGPHPTIPGAEVDTILHNIPETESVGIEFKYDRGNPGGTNQNRTQRAVAVLNDIFRLARLPATTVTTRHFVYLTDGEMASYFSKPTNGLAHFFNLLPDARCHLGSSTVSAASKTLRTGVAKLLTECEVAGVLSRALANNHQLRIYEVLPGQSG